MTCQNCQEDATFHLTQTVCGQVREVHLCGACAKKSGLIATGPAPKLKIDVIVQALLTAHVGDEAGELAVKACECCGTRFMEFRAEGRLGCPHDYEAFAAGLQPILKRLHEATRHVGKTVRRRRIADARPILRLRTKLRQAVEREDFEQAARLRDMLKTSTAGDIA